MTQPPPPLPQSIVNAAYEAAKTAASLDEIPVGAVVFKSETFEIIATAHNESVALRHPLKHAEILAIDRALKKTGEKLLAGYSMYVTLEPCAMCAGAISWARLDRLYYGATDEKTGAVGQGARVFTHSQTHHKPLIEQGGMAQECGALLKDFFKTKRRVKKSSAPILPQIKDS